MEAGMSAHFRNMEKEQCRLVIRLLSEKKLHSEIKKMLFTVTRPFHWRPSKPGLVKDFQRNQASIFGLVSSKFKIRWSLLVRLPIEGA